MDARVNIADDHSASGKNVVNVGPITPEFCLASLQARLRPTSYTLTLCTS